MRGIIIEDESIQPISSQSKFYHKLNLGLVYLILVILGIGVIYVIGLYQNNVFAWRIPFISIWPISLLVTGIAMFKVKDIVSLSVGFLIMILIVFVTLVSIFIRSESLGTSINSSPLSLPISNQFDADILVSFTDARIKSGNTNLFQVKSISNYDKVISNNIKDESGIDKISIKQQSVPPGLGDYNKNIAIDFPNVSPTFLINANMSKVNLDLSNSKLQSAELVSKLSTFDINITDIEDSATLDINALVSTINLNVSQGIKILLVTSATLTQKEFIGLVKSDTYPNTYVSQRVDGDALGEDIENQKTLIINLTSTLSNINIIQK